MELSTQIVNAVVVAAVGFLVWWATRGQIKALADDMNRRFEQVDQRFEQVDQRFEHVDQRFSQIERRFEQVDRRFDQIERRFEHVDRRMSELGGELGAARSDLTRVALAVGAGPSAGVQ